MKIIETKITVTEIDALAKKMFGNLIKAVVDIAKGVMAIDGELHADEETLLLENGSEQSNLWGINLYPEFFSTDDFIEFDSMINVRPGQGNRSRGVEDPNLQKKIREIVNNLVSQ